MKQKLAGMVLTLLLSPALFAGTPDGEKSAMKPECMAMMQKHEGMQKHMAEMDMKLQKLVSEMNQATGNAKVDKTAAVVSELVAQRSMMQKQMMDMHPKMMGHMQGHMQGKPMKGMADSMSSCPMMKEHGKAADSHATPHKH